MKLRRQSQRRRPVAAGNRYEPIKRTAITYRSLSSHDGYAESSREAQAGRHNRNRVANETAIRRLLHNLPTKLAFIAIGGSLLYITTLNTQVNLSAQTAASTSGLLRPRTTYQTAAQTILSQSVFSRSKLTVNVARFEQALQAEFSELERVTLTIPLLGHEPIVGLVSRKPVLKMATNQGVFLLDNEGRALLKASEAVGIDSLNLPLVIDEAQVEVTAGKRVVTASATNYIAELYALLLQKQVAILSMTLPTSSEELRVSLKDKPYVIRFNIDADARQSAGEYFALLAEFNRLGGEPAEYIDLRVPERAFYK